MNLSDQFFDSLESVLSKPIPDKVINRAKESLLDYLAVTCAGAHFQREKMDNFFSFSKPEEGEFKIIGTGKKMVLKEAVFINGLNAHALDYDDGTNAGIIHLGSPIFSLLLPLAQRYRIKLRELLVAVIIGYEVSFTMAVSIQPRHKAMGYHATGTCGTLGAAYAAAYMLGFNKHERFQTFSAACIAASGMLKALDDGSELKPFNVAKTALLALTSLQLAKAGFVGSPDPLGGRGFLKMMAGSEETTIQSPLLNGTYAIEKSYTKPYASCRYTHPAVEAAIELKRQGLKWDDVKRAEVKTYSLAVFGHDHTDVPSPYSAKMSIPYSVAVGLIFGNAGLREFDESVIRDQRVISLMQKISVRDCEEYSSLFPKKQIAELSIDSVSGSRNMIVSYPKGEPENPLSEEEFKQRYAALMEYAEVESANVDLVYNLAHKDDAQVSDILELL